ncbi:PorV/PorQ family protein [Bacteroidota bacterium]
MKKIIFILFIAFQLTQGQTARKYSNEFLNIGVDAAALGMSKSVTATTNDVNAIYWNPAGLVAVKADEGALMHTTQFAGIGNYDYAAAAFVPKGNEDLTLAFALIRFGVDDILNTTALIDNQGNIDFNRIKLFSAADYALNFAIAKKIKGIKNLQVGINAKIVRRTIGDFASSWGFGLDLGAQYKLGKWDFGLMLRDITTTFNYWTIDKTGLEAIQNAIPGQNQEAPSTQEITLPKLHFGIARNFVLKNKKFNLLSEIDFHVRFTETNDIFASSNMSATPSLGLQLDYSKFVFLRAGIGNFQYKNPFNDRSNSLTLEPNLGLGFSYKGIQVDYALSNIASTGNALYSNTFSLKFDFNFFKK